MERQTGTVKWFSSERGYGFIRCSTGTEIFVHHSAIEGDGFKTLRSGDRVTFEMDADERGPKAARVSRQIDPDANRASPDSRTQQSEGRKKRTELPGKGPGGLPTLAEQLWQRLGSRFFGRRPDPIE